MDVAVERAVSVLQPALNASTTDDRRDEAWLEVVARKVLVAGWRPMGEELEQLRAAVAKQAGRPAGPYVDRVEAAAQVLHGRRHRMGWGSVCGRCREDAAAVLAAVS